MPYSERAPSIQNDTASPPEAAVDTEIERVAERAHGSVGNIVSSSVSVHACSAPVECLENGEPVCEYDDTPGNKNCEECPDPLIVCAEKNIDYTQGVNEKPGSPGKVVALAARFAKGLPFWHPGDKEDHGPSDSALDTDFPEDDEDEILDDE